MRIGLTGGIGSGKSTVARIFELLNIPVYFADDRAKLLMQQNSILRQQIIELLGSKAYAVDGSLDRKFIASKVFTDRSLLEKLESFVHPAVFQDSIDWHENQDSPYTMKEAALLYESDSYKDLDRIIVVAAADDIRIQRVMDRDQISEEHVKERMRNQMQQIEKISNADFVIYNNGTELLVPQVMQIHQQILELAK